MIVRNKKTGKIYEALYELGDQTNGREDTRMVVYRTRGARIPEFVREAKEFGAKFEEVELVNGAWISSAQLDRAHNS